MKGFAHDHAARRSLRSVLGVSLFCAVLVTSVLDVCTAVAGPSEDDKVAFRWAMGGLVGVKGDRTLEPLARDAVLKAGEQFKMMVELQKPCFVYLFHQSAQGGLSLLFPYSLQQFETDYRIGRKYYIPRGDAWFELDQQEGKETFHLLASPDRLKDLERLFVQYESSGASNKDELRKQLINEILALRKKHRELAAPAERPVIIGGTIRGLEKMADPGLPDVATVADEVRSGGIMVRSYTIGHQ